jgi:hypothetical protein
VVQIEIDPLKGPRQHQKMLLNRNAKIQVERNALFTTYKTPKAVAPTPIKFYCPFRNVFFSQIENSPGFFCVYTWRRSTCRLFCSTRCKSALFVGFFQMRGTTIEAPAHTSILCKLVAVFMSHIRTLCTYLEAVSYQIRRVSGYTFYFEGINYTLQWATSILYTAKVEH